jgi:hypothetical protein
MFGVGVGRGFGVAVGVGVGVWVWVWVWVAGRGSDELPPWQTFHGQAQNSFDETSDGSPLALRRRRRAPEVVNFDQADASAVGVGL